MALEGLYRARRIPKESDGADPIDIGTVALPLVVTRVDDQRTARMALGLGVNLDAVRRDVAEIFRQAETGAGDE